ncbi:LysR family transcriptional regulator [Delftia acidovorans]|uniref:LysR family transcriptional regulator n=1 Tax=Delftia acidovorans TaxID=80866 RepID=UPI0018E84CDC|nr:LysR family transcriptional regulator [Delftia acidovorans]MBJ2141159.1 LysR family transcriptional regulator [Delftia acidovorans]
MQTIKLLEQMQIFSRVAEMASFTRAADSMGLPKASVSQAVQQLEARLGTRLLHRTTRRVQLTQDGQACYERCQDLLADVDEFQGQFQQAGDAPLQGKVRLDMTTGLARHVVMPLLPQLLQIHPALELELSCTERRVDLVREGFDCVLRLGPVDEPGLVARPLGLVALATCASPGYVQAHGLPATLQDLGGHRLVHYQRTLGARPLGFEYEEDGQPRYLPMAGALTVNNAEAYLAACQAGLGLIQVPRLAVQPLLDAGELVEVLPRHPPPPMPLHLIYAQRRQLPRRVRVLMDWLAEAVLPWTLGAGPAEKP